MQIGNPLLEFNTDFNSRAAYFWSHGLVSDSSYENFNKICNYSQIRRQFQTTGKLSPPCDRVWHQAATEISGYIDEYDVILDVCLSSLSSQSRLLNQLVIPFFNPSCHIALSSEFHSLLIPPLLFSLQGNEKIDVCLGDETFKYLNRKDVQEAIHARLIGVENWTTCSRYTHATML